MFTCDYWDTCHKYLCWGLIVEWRNLVINEKASLVIGGTQTQVLADSMVITDSALNHCTTLTLYLLTCQMAC